MREEQLPKNTPSWLRPILLDNMPDARAVYCSVDSTSPREEPRACVFGVSETSLLALQATLTPQSPDEATTAVSLWSMPSRAVRSVEWTVKTLRQGLESAVTDFKVRIELAHSLGPFGTVELPRAVESDRIAGFEAAKLFAQAAMGNQATWTAFRGPQLRS